MKTIHTAKIDSFSHEGRGIARINGKTTFIDGALPEEIVNFYYTKQKKDFDEGKLDSIVEASLSRVQPLCSHYDNCGGCSLQHLDANLQIQVKQGWLLDLLQRMAHCQPKKILEPLTSNAWNYRNKARLSVRYVEKKQSTLVGFREKNNPRYIAEITGCSVLHPKVAAAIPLLRSMIDTFDHPRIIAQIEVAAGDDKVALIFRNLEALTTNDEEKLREFSDKYEFLIYLQPQGPDSVYLFYPQSTNPVLSYTLPEEALHFEFQPTDFTQVNAGINRLMIQRALHLLELRTDDYVLDLFCGLGNFSLPMAKYCSRVVGIEGSSSMVARAKRNAELNAIINTEFYMKNLEDPAALSGFRQKEFTKLLLDPPRTGALNIVRNIHQLQPERIVYVSCHPVTLARDTEILIHQGYELSAAGVMDMFPHTAHVESIAVFDRLS